MQAVGAFIAAVLAVMIGLIAHAQGSARLYIPGGSASGPTDLSTRMSKAIDGNPSTCYESVILPNPRLSLSFSERMRVDRVSILNTQAPEAGRFSHIRIGTAEEKYVWGLDNITMCVCVDEPQAASAWRHFTCGASGNHVSIILDKTDSLNICEVKMFGEPIGDPTYIPATMRPAPAADLRQCALQGLGSGQQGSMLSCFITCLHDPCCHAVNVTTCATSGDKDAKGMDFVKHHG